MLNLATAVFLAKIFAGRFVAFFAQEGLKFVASACPLASDENMGREVEDDLFDSYAIICFLIWVEYCKWIGKMMFWLYIESIIKGK